MKKANSSSKTSTMKRSNQKKASLTSAPTDNQRYHEANILKLWASQNVYPAQEKSAALPTYVIREMPTPVHPLSIDTLSRKIHQDVFLKYETMRGHTVHYTPLWETFPFNIETHVIKENIHTAHKDAPHLRKKCRQIYSEQLKEQQQKLQTLGIFADWTSTEKTIEARHQTKLFTYFDRLRDAKFLRDQFKLNHWCPNCHSPLENNKTVLPVSNTVLDTYVKFPFSKGFEEFGTETFFAVRFPFTQLWEVAGVLAIAISEDTPFWLTKFQNQYLIFSEPQLKKYIESNTEHSPEPIAKLKPAQLKHCTLSHPLFFLTDLPLLILPELIIDTTTDPLGKQQLKEGIVPLNPAHHSLSYNIVSMFPHLYNAPTPDTRQGPTAPDSSQQLPTHRTPINPIFDEAGKFTEEADTLCGLKLDNAVQFISDQLESHGNLIKAKKHKTKQLQCQHCNGLSVSRPYRHWTFSVGANSLSRDIVKEINNLTEYWEHYVHDLREDIQKQINKISDMTVSSQRQWGVPLPVLRCDNCHEIIADKKVLRSVRSSIRRGTEHWFRLSVEELLPTDTLCANCHSKDFRKGIHLYRKPFRQSTTNT